MNLRNLCVYAVGAMFVAMSVQADQEPDINVHDAYAIAAPGAGTTGAAFMVIHNHGTVDDRLLDVQYPDAARTQLHLSMMSADGVMSMQNITDGLAIPAGGEIVLMRGENHVMFMGLSKPFVEDTTIALTLIFEVAGAVEVLIPVDSDRDQ